ncbi:MAG: beta-mannosidase, partial [Planctomycetota bacterium]
RTMQTLDLGGSWTVRQANERKTLPATVPGDVFGDLTRAKAIPDPYVRDNEADVRWVGRTDWVYARTFTVPKTLLDHDRVLLHCEGLDTLATVKLNGKVVGTADNMFRTWEWDVRKALKAGENRIEVTFASAENYITERQRKRPIPSWGGPHEPRGRAWLRKEPCNFGWDWGPVLITCGIWKAIRLVGYDAARLSDLHIRQDHTPKKAVGLDLAVAAEAVGRQRLRVRATVRDGKRTVAEAEAPIRSGKAKLACRVDQPKLWWPNGMGDQPLYDVRVELLDADGAVLDAWDRRIGLRTLVLDRHKDQWGESFRFVANGAPIFAKGANWIPHDAILSRMTPARYRRILEDAAAANMNMLRVWGGGIYEDDTFYALCDELGLCVWQDFMFACSTYPTFDKAWMANVKVEAEENVRRLRHHPSIALWCGNNELEQGLVGPKWTDRQMSWTDYKKLFDKALPAVVERLDPERAYWPCSPHTPHGDRSHHRDPTCGDAHLWDVWHGRRPFEWYRTCEHRFNSEFGFQSFPHPRTVRGFTAKGDRNVTSAVMEHHQRSGIGNDAILQYMCDWFLLPKDFENTVWLSQILQAMAMKYAVEHWRRSMPRGMGTLYWQLNDCWPVASWASVDGEDRWKALHYLARRFYAPLLVSGVEDLAAGRVDVHATSDLRAKTDAALAWTVASAAGKRLASGREAITCRPGRDARVARIDLADLLAAHGPRDLLVWLRLTAKGQPASENLVHLARPKHLLLENPRIRATTKTRKDGAFDVTLKAGAAALWAWVDLSATDARCSDNFVHLRPGAATTLRVEPARTLKAAEFRRQLTVRSLFDTFEA